MGWYSPHLRLVFLSQPRPLQACPEACLQGDSRSCQVARHHYTLCSFLLAGYQPVLCIFSSLRIIHYYHYLITRLNLAHCETLQAISSSSLFVDSSCCCCCCLTFPYTLESQNVQAHLVLSLAQAQNKSVL